MVGVRGNLALSNRFSFIGWGFLGGFGAGSDLMADVFGGLECRFSRPVDYEGGDFLYDVAQQGTMAGMIFRF